MEVNFSGHVTRVVALEESSQVGQARREALALAETAGFNETDAGRVALAAMELATNVLKHGHGGAMHLSLVQGRSHLGVELTAIDRGPGFVLSQCLADGYSTGGTQGLGLGAIQRQAALLEAWSDRRGTVVIARVYPQRRASDVDLPYGALRLPMRHETACGDAWHLTVQGARIVVTLIDGLGHGISATEAAQAGVATAARVGVDSATRLIEQVHAGMSGTRGGAAAVARIDFASGGMEFAGIGNIAASVHGDEQTHGLASHAGIVGVQFRKVQAFPLHVTPGTLLIMHSDGLQGRWNLRDYPGLVRRHPALVAAILQRDFDRGRDDASIVTLRLDSAQWEAR